MAVMKTDDARSPFDTNHPCAQHVGAPASKPSRATQSRLSRNASACCMSARNRLRIRIRNWFGGSRRRRSQSVVAAAGVVVSEGVALEGRAGMRKPLWSKSSEGGREEGALRCRGWRGRICQETSL